MNYENRTYERKISSIGVCVWKRFFCQHEESTELCLMEIGEDQCPPDYDWGPDRKGFHTLHYVLDGKGVLMLNDNYFEISAGEAFYLAPDDFAYYRADKEEPWKYIWIRYYGTKADIIMSMTALSSKKVLPDSEDKIIGQYMDKFLENGMNTMVNNFQLTGLCYSFLGELINRYPRTSAAKDNVKVSYLDTALDYIESNYNRRHIIGELTKKLNLTRAYVYKLFKKHLGCSPSEYLEQYRIDRACTLLATGQLSGHAVAYAVGYTEYSSFFKVFKEKTGMTPKQYQDAHMPVNEGDAFGKA